MNFEVSNENWSVELLVNNLETGKATAKIDTQRGLVWNKKTKSLLIYSVLLGVPINVFWVNKLAAQKRGKYEILDGQQRSDAIFAFFNNGFALDKTTPAIIVNDDDGERVLELAGLKFKDLPEVLKLSFKSYGITVARFTDSTKEQKKLFFRLINNGKQVSASDLTVVNTKSRKEFMNLSKHKALNVFVNDLKKESMIQQIWILGYEMSESLLSKDIGSVLTEQEISEEHIERLNSVLDYIAELQLAVESNKFLKSKFKNKTHFVGAGYMAFRAIERDMSSEDFIQRITEFFETGGRERTTISNDYNAAVQGGAKTENVRKRMGELDKALG
jgi:uncharacterized protein with ParB-like and HNH nuclease domain